jgi:hypothetical protein
MVNRSFPCPGRAKPILLITALVLAGCGGHGASWQTVTGDGYRFLAPGDWTLTQGANAVMVSKGRVDRVQVETFRLVEPYRPELFAAASRELDRVAREVGHELRGHVAASATVRVAGMDARSYRITYGRLVEEITFVLDARREYELLCRRIATATDETCGKFVRSFALG